MAETDQNQEGVEPEGGEQTSPPKKAAKKKAAKKKVAKKKAAKKAVTKKAKAATATESKPAAEKKAQKAVAEKKAATPKAEAPSEAVSKPQPAAPAAPVHGGAVEAEQEKNQVVMLWVAIALVCFVLIAALSPTGEKSAPAHKAAPAPEAAKPAHEPAATAHEAPAAAQPAEPAHAAEPAPAATPSAPSGESKLFELMVPEKFIFGKKGASAPPEGSRPPERPAGSPPGYWQFESGEWRFVPYAGDAAAEPAEQPAAEKQPESKLFQQMIPEKYIFGKQDPAEAPAPQTGNRPPETPADAPPGYWHYESGEWRYVPYQHSTAVEAPAAVEETAAATAAPKGSKLFQNMIPEKYIFGTAPTSAGGQPVVPPEGVTPPELPADSPPGYWVYTAHDVNKDAESPGYWVYVPYGTQAKH